MDIATFSIEKVMTAPRNFGRTINNQIYGSNGANISVDIIRANIREQELQTTKIPTHCKESQRQFMVKCHKGFNSENGAGY
ncbi:hypothetical protein MXB_5130 [Myxobolus squamalis]|nr:hypothetical protein MXB_5130 [Myxobolus squamalis]